MFHTELLQIVMFSLYGNQYGEREEHLLLKMFEVKINLLFSFEVKSINSKETKIQAKTILKLIGRLYNGHGFWFHQENSFRKLLNRKFFNFWNR